jgi:hypothetical protein
MKVDKLSLAGMGNISKRRQLKEKILCEAVQDLSYYNMGWILKFSLKHHLMNEIEIF